jgi:hypothetical protein
MKHEKTFEAIDKLKEIEIELHRLKNALEMANRALAKHQSVACAECGADEGHALYCVACAEKYVKRTWVGLTKEEIDQGLLRSPYALQNAGAWREGVAWAMQQLKDKNNV